MTYFHIFSFRSIIRITPGYGYIKPVDFCVIEVAVKPFVGRSADNLPCHEHISFNFAAAGADRPFNATKFWHSSKFPANVRKERRDIRFSQCLNTVTKSTVGGDQCSLKQRTNMLCMFEKLLKRLTDAQDDDN